MSGDTQAEATRALSGKRLGAAALLLAASVLLSRVLGFVRDMVLADRLGVGPETDAFSAAFQIPDLLNYLLAGGALAIAFTPLYLAVLRDEGDAAAARLFHTVLGTLAAVTTLLTAVLWLYADGLIGFQFSRFPDDTQSLTTRLTRIVLPAQIFFVTGGVMRAVAMAHGRFLSQALAPLFYNGAIIVGGLLGEGVDGFAWGALFGAVVGQLLVPLYELRGVSSLRLRVRPFDPRFRAYLLSALPLMLGLSLTTVDEWYERWFGQALGVGVVASLAFARRLMMAPVAVVGQAVATAALPTLAAHHAEGRDDAVDATLLRTLRATIALAIVAAAALAVFAGPIVQAIYERGRFEADDTARVAALLAILALAVPGWVSQQVAIRAFFARAEMWRPMLLGTAMALGAIPLYGALGRSAGAEGLAAAGAIAISANAVATLGWARVRFGGPSLGPLAETALRSALVAAPAALVGHLALAGGPGLLGAVRDLVLGGAAFGAVALLLAWPLGDETMRALLARAGSLLRRSSRRPAGAGPADDVE